MSVVLSVWVLSVCSFKCLSRKIGIDLKIRVGNCQAAFQSSCTICLLSQWHFIISMNFSYSGVSNGFCESMWISVMLECSVTYQKMGIWLVFSFKGKLNFYKILSCSCEPCLTLQTWIWWLSGPSPCSACVCNGFDVVPGLKRNRLSCHPGLMTASPPVREFREAKGPGRPVS